MKYRESGMPEENYWETFFNPLKIFKDLGLDVNSELVVDVGSGYGTFTFPAADYVNGKVIGMDIDHELVVSCQKKSALQGLDNVEFQVRDVSKEGFGFESGLVDCVLLFNILHCEEPYQLLTTSYDALRKGGKLFIIHWKYDETPPRGPSMAIRPTPEKIIDWAEKSSYRLVKQIDIEPYHYGLSFVK